MEKPTFEQAITRIDEIVRTLEKGDAPLEKSLSLFEEGTKLIKFCSKLLDTAEQQVVRLQKGADGAPEETPFDPEE
jgi:exodeoxyribonuclease VII small subunit